MAERDGQRAAGNGSRRPGTGGETHQVSDAEHAPLTTRQGVPVADDQNTLRLGERGPALLEDFHFREKIFHFDHERIPERGRARARLRRPRVLRELRVACRPHPRRPVPARRRANPGVRAVLDGGGQQGLGRPARATSAASQSSSTRKQGNWDLVGNNIPVFFIQDPIKFPDFDPRVPSRSPTGASRRPQTAHDNFWDFVSLDARVDAHAHVGDVGPRHPAQLPLHGGVRGPHLPLRERGGPVHVREVPLEARARSAVGGVERGAQDQRRRPRLPPPRPVGRDRQRRVPRVGARHAALRRRLRRPVRLRRARRHQAHPRGGGAGAPGRQAGARIGSSTTSSPRPSRSRSARRTSSTGSTSPTTRCCRGGTSRTSTRS